MRELADVLRETLPGRATDATRRSAEALRDTYRSGAAPATLAIADAASAAAYAAYRMPATSAAIARALESLVPVWDTTDPPRSHLDLGGGTGAAVWAAHGLWPGIRSRVLDASEPALALGRRLAGAGADDGLAATEWELTRLAPGTRLPNADLTTVSYLLGELSPELAGEVVDTCLASTRALAIVEPGTPRGYAAVLAAWERVLASGWRLLAPCPHAARCPLAPGDWCHFSVRIQRSALHRQLKDAELGHEDEKFSYLVAIAPEVAGVPGAEQRAAEPPESRVLRHPLTRKGLVQLRLCTPEGTVRDEIVSKRQGPRYRLARDTDWGDTFPAT
jgi:ribosomal protein RSM22 (predicted rRNA methylase)